MRALYQKRTTNSHTSDDGNGKDGTDDKIQGFVSGEVCLVGAGLSVSQLTISWKGFVNI